MCGSAPPAPTPPPEPETERDGDIAATKKKQRIAYEAQKSGKQSTFLSELGGAGDPTVSAVKLGQ